MKFALASLAVVAARQQELVSIGEKVAQMRKGNLEYDPLTGEIVVRSTIGVKDPFPFGTMEMHSNEAEWQTDAPAGYKEHLDEVPHPDDDAFQMLAQKRPVPIGLLLIGDTGSYIMEHGPEQFDVVKEVIRTSTNEEEWKEGMNPGYANAITWD